MTTFACKADRFFEDVTTLDNHGKVYFLLIQLVTKRREGRKWEIGTQKGNERIEKWEGMIREEKDSTETLKKIVVEKIYKRNRKSGDKTETGKGKWKESEKADGGGISKAERCRQKTLEVQKCPIR